MRRPQRRNVSRARVVRGSSIPVPTEGWDASSNLAEMPPQRAIILDNFFPRADFVELRRGYRAHSILRDGDEEQLTQPVETLMAYHGLTDAQDRLFAIGGGSIYNVTDGGPSFGVPTGQAGLSNSRFQFINTSTTGGNFLIAVNGIEARVYNGTAWSTPAFTGFTGSNFVNVNAFKRRVWFIVANSMKAVYTGPDAFQGALTEYDFSGIFYKGGYLVAMGTWTIDGGSGVDDHAVFVTSEGQVAVYAGNDPSSASDWNLVGVYDLGSPLGFRCFTKVGGDLALICIDGVIPLSASLIFDRAAIEQVSLTSRISHVMNEAARRSGSNFGWQIIGYPRGQMAILNVPIQESVASHQFVMNVNTGAWCRFIGQNAVCWEVFKDRLFFGGLSGMVNEADSAAADGQSPIVGSIKTAFNYFRDRGSLKRFTAFRPVVVSDGQVTPSMTLNLDFENQAPPQITTTPLVAGARWDEVDWDNFQWANEQTLTRTWEGAIGVGQCAAIYMRVEGNVVTDALWDVSLWDAARWDGQDRGQLILQVTAFDLVYESGEFF